MKKHLLATLTLALAALSASAANTIDDAKCTTTPEAGKFYRLICPLFTSTDKTIYIDGFENNKTWSTLHWGTYNEGNAAYVWTFEPTGTNNVYVMRNLLTGQMPRSKNPLEASYNDNTVTLNPQNVNPIVSIKVSGADNPFHANSHSSGNGNTGTVIPYGTDDGTFGTGSACAWKIEEISEEVALQAINNALDYKFLPSSEFTAEESAILADDTKTAAEKYNVLKRVQPLINTTLFNGVNVENCTTAPEPGKLYRIVCPMFTYCKAMYSTSTGGFGWNTYDENNPEFIWTFTPTADGKYEMRNLASKLYPADAASNSSIATVATSTPVTIANILTNLPEANRPADPTALQEKEVKININDRALFHCYNHNSGNGTSGNICTWTPGNNELLGNASSWVIELIDNPKEYLVENLNKVVPNFLQSDDLKAKLASETSSAAEIIDAYYANTVTLQDVYPVIGKYYLIKPYNADVYWNGNVNQNASYTLTNGADKTYNVFQFMADSVLCNVATNAWHNDMFQRVNSYNNGMRVHIGSTEYGLTIRSDHDSESRYAHNSTNTVNRCKDMSDHQDTHSWLFVEAERIDVLRAMIAQAENATNPFGVPTASVIAAAKAVAQDENATVDQINAQITNLNSGTNNRVKPAAGAYYTIEASPNVGHPKSMDRTYFYCTNHVAHNNIQKTLFQPANKTTANSIWLFDDDKLLNYDNGLYMNVNTSNFLGSASEPGSSTAIKFVGGYNEANTLQIIYNGGRGLHNNINDGKLMLDACGTSESNTRAENAHNVVVTPVTSLPVHISHADNCATVKLPVAFTVPQADDVTFYECTTVEGNKMHFEPINYGQTVAAGTPVVIRSTGTIRDINLPIAAATPQVLTATAAEENVFGGSHIATVHSCSDTDDTVVYVKTAEEPNMDAEKLADVHFKKLNNGDVIPAHAVTLTLEKDSDEVPDYMSLSLTNDTKATTSIESVEVEAEVVIKGIYDLQGRRLAAPVKGVNIINGKKVIIK